MIDDYNQNGYRVLRGFYTENELAAVREVVTKFHHAWIEDNAQFYAERAINSAYLTGKKYLGDSERAVLFQIIASAKLMDVVTSILGPTAAFINTQLFFDPHNKNLNNYWHRDPQYHLSLEEQQAALTGPKALHFRIPLRDEPGLEVVPGTHRRWDNDEELAVRLEQQGRKNSDDLATGERVSLAAGDLMIFNANLIHRGIYGMNRLSLDVLFSDPVVELFEYVDENCLPGQEILETLEQPSALIHSIRMKTQSKTGA
ncbi:MAG: hypothetical protein Tsb002_32920 [Wenzhouxiangellaceae bacterium]